MKKSDRIKGVNLTVLSALLLVITVVVFSFIIIVTNNVYKRFNLLRDSLDKYFISENCSERMRVTAANLSELAKMFVVTRDIVYAEEYLDEIFENQTQRKAWKELSSIFKNEDFVQQRLRIIITQSKSLVDLELYAIKMGLMELGEENVPAEFWERLSNVKIGEHDATLPKDKIHDVVIEKLFGQGYLICKKRVSDSCRIIVSSVRLQIKHDVGVTADELGMSISHMRELFFFLLLMNILMVVALIFFVMIPIRKFLYSIKHDEKLKTIGSTEFKNLAKSYNEIYDLKADNEKSLSRKAECDALTEILNRRAFDRICNNFSIEKKPIALLLIDLDDFKRINDTYGHAGGDFVLQELAWILKDTFRTGDYVARIGGDEFAAILPNFKSKSLGVIVRKIAKANEDLKNIKEGMDSVSISVGVAFSEEGYSEELYKQADKALYKVKETGKCDCMIYSPKIE